jgi:hypothetical protein
VARQPERVVRVANRRVSVRQLASDGREGRGVDLARRTVLAKEETQMEAQAPRHRPVGVTVLAILAWIAVVFNGIITLLFFGAIPVALFGRTGFFGQALLGAILWGLLTLIWIWVATGLWNLNPQAWLFVVVIAVFDLILAFVSLLGATSFGTVWPSILVNAVILIYALSPGVKEAFGPPAQHT